MLPSSFPQATNSKVCFFMTPRVQDWAPFVHIRDELNDTSWWWLSELSKQIFVLGKQITYPRCKGCGLMWPPPWCSDSPSAVFLDITCRSRNPNLPFSPVLKHKVARIWSANTSWEQFIGKHFPRGRTIFQHMITVKNCGSDFPLSVRYC